MMATEERESMDEILRKHYAREAAYEAERKGTLSECRVPDGPHSEGISDYG